MQLAKNYLEQSAGHSRMLPSRQYTGTTTADVTGGQMERFYEAYRKNLGHLFT